MIGKIWKNVTCERYTELASKSMETELTSFEKFLYFIHHIVCTFCRRSRRQFLLIEKALSQFEKDDEASKQAVSLPKEAKQRIKSSLDSQI